MRDYAEIAMDCPSSWQRFGRAAKAAENKSLGRRIAAIQVTIETQFAHRPPSARPAADMPLTTTTLDQLTRPIVAALYPRRYVLRSRQRLNRLPTLSQLHVDGDN